MKKLVIVGAQLNFLVGDIEGNTQLIIDAANQAYQESKADLILFPNYPLPVIRPKISSFAPPFIVEFIRRYKPLPIKLKIPL